MKADDDPAEFIIVINALTTLLTLMLVTVAALGVLNMVVLETRERVDDQVERPTVIRGGLACRSYVSNETTPL
jgi:hypothetical protein